jgi:hypothetical protein
VANDPQKNNIFPVHKDFQTLGSGTTFNALVSPLASSARAFQSFKTLNSGTTFSSPASSGFQYIGGGTPLVIVACSFQDAQPGADSLTVFTEWTRNFIEAQPSTDFIFTGTVPIAEGQPGADALFTHVTTYFTEAQPGADSLSIGGTLSESQPGADALFVHITKYFNEYVVCADEPVDAFTFFDVTDSYCISVQPEFITDSSNTISVDGYYDSYVSTDIVVKPASLAPVTSLTASGNQFLPTLIQDGVTYVTNACSAPPPGYVGTPGIPYIGYTNNPIGGTTFCNLTGSNLSLDFSGGTFNIASQAPLGTGTTYQDNLGKQVAVYGLSGTITDFGKTISSSSNTYVTQGIFGTPNLNKAFTLLTYGAGQYFSFLTTNTNLQAAPPINSYTTLKGMAQAIGALCGVTVSWLIPDGPYHDIFSQNGITGLEALNTLAAQMGGQVRWDGANTYTVAYPDYYSGIWTVPLDTLLDAQGLKYSNHQDLSYGVSGSGVLGIPTNNFFPSTIKTVPQNTATSPQDNIEVVATVTKPYTSDDPITYIDLPNDIVSVKIQILVNPGQAGIGAQYVTDNASIWYDLGSPGLGNPYVPIIKVGNAFVNKIALGYTLFPNLAAINNGNFTMSFGIVRTSLNTQFEAEVQDLDLQKREIQARIAANIKYIKTYSGTIVCKFFGTVPVPGMWASATFCGETVEGVIESVTITGAGIVTIEVARYFRINFLDAKLDYALTSGNYGVL